MKRLSILTVGLLISLTLLLINCAAAAPIYYSGNGHYYEAIYAPEGITWEKANTAAQSLFYSGINGHLATITSQEENDFIARNVRGYEYWLGGFQPDGSSEPDSGWQWITGETWDYTNWDISGEPNNYYWGGYVTVYNDPIGTPENVLQFHYNDMWNDLPDDCLVPGYIVEYDVDSASTTPIYYSGTGHYYQAIYVPEGITWEEAKTAAQSLSYSGMNGHLATITSQEENDFIASNVGGYEYWLGGIQSSGSLYPAEGWQWITGEAWDCTVWAGGEPNDDYGGERGVLPPRSPEDALEFWGFGGWNDYPSVVPLEGYIVEYDVGAVIATPIYYSGNGHYYEAIYVPEGITWEEAKTAAESLSYNDMNGYLATITSQDENDFIINNFDTYRCWLGGFQPDGSLEPDGGWQWVTSETWDYTNWHTGVEPNNAYGGESGIHPEGTCEEALQIRDDLMWNDYPDNVPERGYIVEYSVTNNPPVAEANGPYISDEASLIVFNASASSDPDGDFLTYEWDFDNDGEFDDFSSSEPTATYTWEDDYTGPVSLKVTDEKGLSDTATAEVTVNNVAPDVGGINSSVDPIQLGTSITVDSTFTDVGTNDTHTAVWDWGDDSLDSGIITENGGSGTVSGTYTYSSADVYKINLTVTDDDGGSNYSVSKYVVIYDPEGGFVTGGGWINSPVGAYQPDTNLTGTANFGFVSKYKKGATVPTGVTQFNFQVADLNFHSDTYEWLVIAGSRAQYKGTGTINGEGEYGFMLTAIDGELGDEDDTDKFRIKIWDKASEAIVYDNMLDVEDDEDPTTVIQGGSITIHKE